MNTATVLQWAWNILGILSVLTPLIVRGIAAARPEFGESVTAKVLLRIANDFVGAKKKRDKMAAAKAAPPMSPPSIPTDVDISEMDGPADSPRFPRGQQ